MYNYIIMLQVFGLLDCNQSVNIDRSVFVVPGYPVTALLKSIHLKPNLGLPN